VERVHSSSLVTRPHVEGSAQSRARRSVLVVDLDGTLLAGDLLVEQTLWLAGRRPLALLILLLSWLRKPSRLGLKSLLASAADDLPIDRLPYRAAVLSHIHAARADGRQVVLATASLLTMAEKVAAHLQCFDHVIGSAARNLRGHEKLVAIREHLHDAAFEYVGDHVTDRPIWEAATEATIVTRSTRAERLLPGPMRRAGQPVVVIDTPSATFTTWISGLRVHQWSKNLLVLVPVIAGQRVGDTAVVTQALLVALGASFLASAVYLSNDLLDVHADRGRRDRARPVAEGRLTYTQALLGILACALVATGIGVWAERTTPMPILALFAVYVAANAAYSMQLKRVMMLDIILLSMMYLWRIVLGSAATGIVLSEWMLAFSVFFFMGLACAKRCIGLATAPAARQTGPALTADVTTALRTGRGYVAADLPVVREIGIAASLVSILVFALYVKDTETAALYGHPTMLWGLVVLTLYWVTRMWLLVARGVVSSDPVEFATRDRTTYLVAIGAVAALLAAR
jgi:4-hydroxybenzoate polyprenyltransferase/phosphoserine phosphatase